MIGMASMIPRPARASATLPVVDRWAAAPRVNATVGQPASATRAMTAKMASASGVWVSWSRAAKGGVDVVRCVVDHDASVTGGTGSRGEEGGPPRHPSEPRGPYDGRCESAEEDQRQQLAHPAHQCRGQPERVCRPLGLLPRGHEEQSEADEAEHAGEVAGPHAELRQPGRVRPDPARTAGRGAHGRHSRWRSRSRRDGECSRGLLIEDSQRPAHDRARASGEGTRRARPSGRAVSTCRGTCSSLSDYRGGHDRAAGAFASARVEPSGRFLPFRVAAGDAAGGLRTDRHPARRGTRARSARGSTQSVRSRQRASCCGRQRRPIAVTSEYVWCSWRPPSCGGRPSSDRVRCVSPWPSTRADGTGSDPSPTAALLLGVAVVIAQLALDPLESAGASWTWSLNTLWVFGVGAWARQQALLAEKARARRTRSRRPVRRRAASAPRRDLHDILAHHLAVMLIQAEAADEILDVDPHRAHRALEHVHATGRAALEEVRGLLTTLRAEPVDPDGADLLRQSAPAREAHGIGIERVPALVETVRRSGLPVTLTVAGNIEQASETTSAVAYRVVQEALTNTLRHAGPVATESPSKPSTATWSSRWRTANRLRRVPARRHGRWSHTSGQGLRGMRERVEGSRRHPGRPRRRHRRLHGRRRAAPACGRAAGLT